MIFGTTVVFMLLLAYALHRVVEKPLAPLIKRVLSKPVAA